MSSEQPQTAQPRMTLDVVLNLSRYHREHEKFYAQAPLETALRLHEASKVLKMLADRWSDVEPLEQPPHGRYVGCEDLNERAAIQSNGVLMASCSWTAAYRAPG